MPSPQWLRRSAVITSSRKHPYLVDTQGCTTAVVGSKSHAAAAAASASVLLRCMHVLLLGTRVNHAAPQLLKLTVCCCCCCCFDDCECAGQTHPLAKEP
jgi:hypothetical protein